MPGRPRKPHLPATIPSHILPEIGKGKIRQVNAQYLADLVASGQMTGRQLFEYVNSGLRPRTINSHIEDLRRGRLTVTDMLESAARALQNRIPGERYGKILRAPKGQFMQGILSLLAQGYRPPYTFVWGIARKRVMRRDKKGGWLYPENFRKSFESGYWKYYKQSGRRFNLIRRLERAIERGNVYAIMGLEQQIDQLDIRLLTQRREIGRMIAQM